VTGALDQLDVEVVARSWIDHPLEPARRAHQKQRRHGEISGAVSGRKG
jgi:hypothetical protein